MGAYDFAPPPHGARGPGPQSVLTRTATVCKSHLKWGTFLPNLDTLGLWLLELFAMYAMDGQTDGRTDGRTDKSKAYCPFPTGVGIISNDAPDALLALSKAGLYQ